MKNQKKKKKVPQIPTEFLSFLVRMMRGKKKQKEEAQNDSPAVTRRSQQKEKHITGCTIATHDSLTLLGTPWNEKKKEKKDGKRCTGDG